MISIILLIIGIVSGLVIAWLWAKAGSAAVVQKVQVEADSRPEGGGHRHRSAGATDKRCKAFSNSKKKKLPACSNSCAVRASKKSKRKPNSSNCSNGWRIWRPCASE